MNEPKPNNERVVKHEIAYQLAKGDEDYLQDLLEDRIKNIVAVKCYFDSLEKQVRCYFCLMLRKDPSDIDKLTIVTPSLVSSETESTNSSWEDYLSFLYEQYENRNTNHKESALINQVLVRVVPESLLVHVRDSLSGDPSRLVRKLSEALYNYTKDLVHLECHVEEVNEVDYIYVLRQHNKSQEEGSSVDGSQGAEGGRSFGATSHPHQSLQYWKERYPDLIFLKGYVLVGPRGSPVTYYERGDVVYLRLDATGDRELGILKHFKAYNEETTQVGRLEGEVVEVFRDDLDCFYMVVKVMNNYALRAIVNGSYNLLLSPRPPLRLKTDLKTKRKRRLRLRLMLFVGGVGAALIAMVVRFILLSR